MSQTPTGTTPATLSEGHIQLPPDSTGKLLRSFPVLLYEQQGDGTFAQVTSYQQVFMLADGMGNVIGVPGSPMYVQSDALEVALDEIHDTLREILHVLQENR